MQPNGGGLVRAGRWRIPAAQVWASKALQDPQDADLSTPMEAGQTLRLTTLARKKLASVQPSGYEER